MKATFPPISYEIIILLENGSRRKHFCQNSLMHLFNGDRPIVQWMHSHIGCICLLFLHGVLSNVSSSVLHVKMYTCIGYLASCYDEMLSIWWWRVCAGWWHFGVDWTSWQSRKCHRPGSTASARPTTSTSTTLPRTADHQACCHRRSTFCTPCLRFLLLGARPLRSNWGLGPHNLRGPAINMHCNFKYPF